MQKPPFPLALTLLSSLSLPLLATEVPSLPTVSVTAKGYAADDSETPASTTTINSAQLQAAQAHNLGDALRGQPGLGVASDSPHGQNPVIRGLKKESTVLLVDGMRVNSAQPQGAVGSLMGVGLAEQVEVVKGPASVLYGSGALGGAIQVRLPQARFTPGLGFDASVDYDSASQGVRTTGVLNTANEDHAFLLGGSAARVGDYTAPTGTVAQTGYHSDALTAQYRMRMDAQQQLRASVQRQNDTDVWYPGSKKPHANVAVVGNTTVHSPAQERNAVELGYARKSGGEAPLNLDARVYRQEVKRSIYSYSDKLKRDIGQSDVVFATNGLDLKADWLAHPEHLLSLGLNSWRTQASPTRYLANPTPASPLVRNDPFSNGTVESVGAFLQDDMHLGAWNVLAGLRHDTVRGNADAVGVTTTGLQRQDSASSGSLGAIYEAAPLLRPYANLSHGFRAADLRERFESSPRGDGYHYLGNPQIQPEFATQWELGIKGDDNGLQYQVALYRNRISNFITGQPTGATIGGLPVKQTVNLGEAVIEGLEASTRWQVRTGHWLQLAFSRLRGENKDLNEPLFQMPADELSLRWDGDVAPGWTLDSTLRLVAEQNRVATVFSRGSENATPGFATLDIGANWRFAPKQTLRIAVRNLADKTYYEHLSEGVSGQEIAAVGRSLQVTWKGSF